MYPTPGRTVMVYEKETDEHYPGIIVYTDVQEAEPPMCMIQMFGCQYPTIKNDKGNVYGMFPESDGTVPDTWYWPPRADDTTNTRYSFHGNLHYLDVASGKMVPCYSYHPEENGPDSCHPVYKFDTEGRKIQMTRPERRDLGVQRT